MQEEIARAQTEVAAKDAKLAEMQLQAASRMDDLADKLRAAEGSATEKQLQLEELSAKSESEKEALEAECARLATEQEDANAFRAQLADEIATLEAELRSNDAEKAEALSGLDGDERMQFEQRIADMTKTMQEEIARAQTEVAAKDAKLAEMQLQAASRMDDLADKLRAAEGSATEKQLQLEELSAKSESEKEALEAWESLAGSEALDIESDVE